MMCAFVTVNGVNYSTLIKSPYHTFDEDGLCLDVLVNCR